ncbi:hypothetical protein [Profundicola chukchiensis]|nr:hypothetical protein [Profundicola chukchiensis]
MTRMYFPNGGMLDDELNNADISDGKATVRLGTKTYDVKVKSKGEDCLDNVVKATQCKGRTKKGKRCKNETGDASGKCHWHR